MKLDDMKKTKIICVIGAAVLCLILFVIFMKGTAYAEMPEAYYDEQELWDELSKLSPSDEITSGVMGYFMRESRLKPDAVPNWTHWNHMKGVTDICREFTEKIDAGLSDGSTRDIFVWEVQHIYGGYGLGQWYVDHYLEDFYEFVREREGSIADVTIQCEFVFESMKQNERLWEDLCSSTDPYHTGKIIGFLYDGASSLGAETIASYSRMFYKEYAQ